ncbi:stage V sporulation protein AD [Ethanoligenens harbinense]|uniref:Stage V sporulation protein AD n=1 Tax=Ethanoligenens harbinense (strain DSM 18485 / JCM 12961 / CGMCC 1.5033 / YUAN-3) TaxID=663278 RepID=E6U7D0_ETHHY|nr:stage V sporulation protein AD [Ethanoligenens harbinense]ADU25865.1 stage V sporulation protein AD [Ethanoligenens harbinense YUAN-3]AVQ95026.1 stage V sporulation protein AD [Ethanoligenens harbinense YUAN-3]AYF37719.1 stage V sporulation protein AD [Ethanoligenens harbinense]AYF40438.1 stage V sporulation protein AD [Ethanoligenens harbinense]QCN91273.1 stage V sporulation protein AD [Ethanoligenens harbinense]
MATRVGRYTIRLDQPPSVMGYASVVGKKEGEGPLADEFDQIEEDTTFGEKTWEKAESRLQNTTLNKALGKADITPGTVDIIFAGDLLNQCIGTSYGLREFGIPFAGLYGACSTMAESLAMAAVFVEGGFANVAAALTSSHFCSAERQYRLPLEYGGQRAPSAQWTVTGSGAVILGREGDGPYARELTFGRMVDLGIKDQSNMGAAMAPAAADTLQHYFDDTGVSPDRFDLIVTGDLGAVGSNLLRELLQKEGVTLGENYNDCGLMIYDRDRQDVHAGGSGCGCAASVLCSHILNNMKSGHLHEVLFMATGVLMSPLSVQQGQSIPSVAHAVHLSTSR